MLIVAMMDKWSDDSACCVVHDVRLYSVLDNVVISGEDVCCSVVFVTLVCVFVRGCSIPSIVLTSRSIYCILFYKMFVIIPRK